MKKVLLLIRMLRKEKENNKLKTKKFKKGIPSIQM